MPAGRSQEQRRGIQCNDRNALDSPQWLCYACILLSSPLVQICLWAGAMLKERQNLTVPRENDSAQNTSPKESHPACIPLFPISTENSGEHELNSSFSSSHKEGWGPGSVKIWQRIQSTDELQLEITNIWHAATVKIDKTQQRYNYAKVNRMIRKGL